MKAIRPPILYLIIAVSSPSFTILAQDASVQHDHVIPGYLFNVYENDVEVSKKVWLWVDADKAAQTITCNLIYILVDSEKEAVSLEAHHYSTSNGTIENLEIDPRRISFDLSLSWLVPGRTIRVACDGSNSNQRYEVTGIGLWRVVGGDGTVKVEWKQTDEIILPYSKVVVPFLELVKE